MKDSLRRFLEFCRLYGAQILLYVTIPVFIAGHIINSDASPRPLNAWSNKISDFAASNHGGMWITACIIMFGLAELLLGYAAFRQNRPDSFSSLAGWSLACGALPMILIGVFPTFRPDENYAANIHLRTLARHIRSAPEIYSDHLHSLMSALAFPLLIAGIFFLGMHLKKTGTFKWLGMMGVGMVPLISLFLLIAYFAPHYEGYWQRIAFALPFGWMMAVSRRLRRLA